MKIMPMFKAEVNFWIQNISRVNGQPFLKSRIIRALDIFLNTDASGSGWGIIIYLSAKELASSSVLWDNFKKLMPSGGSETELSSIIHSGVRICGIFSREEAAKSSNFRELLSVWYSLRAGRLIQQNVRLDLPGATS